MFRELQQQHVWHWPPTLAPHWLHQPPAMGAKQKSGHTKKKDWKFSPPERTWGAARLKFKANSAFSVWPVRTCLATMELQNQNESISHSKSPWMACATTPETTLYSGKQTRRYVVRQQTRSGREWTAPRVDDRFGWVSTFQMSTYLQSDS